MLSLALNTAFHILMGILIFIMISLELFVLSSELNRKESKLLSLFDGIYGVAAILVVATGILNWMVFGKGYDYYANNLFFIIKFSTFIIIGLLSIYPTIAFAKLKKAFKQESNNTKILSNYSTIKTIIIIELGLMILMPIFATLMANGITF